MQSGREDTLEERYAIKFCFKLGKTATETYGMLQTAYGPSCMNRSSFRDQETEFPVEACWISQTQEGQTEQVHPETHDDPFF